MNETLLIRRAAVLGAGVMGANLAALLANAGLSVLLLDVPPQQLLPEEQEAGRTLGHPAVRNRLAREGLRRALLAQPPAFTVPRLAQAITVGNLEDDLKQLAEVDWVLEAVVEDAAVKAELYRRLEPHLAPHALLTSNTSGLRCAVLAEALSPARQARFFVTHFFNPPRYMHLLELVPAPQTNRAVLAAFAAFAERDLGKGCVVARDTPNFIANRIGIAAFLDALRLLESGAASVVQIDALTGELIGRPKSATFRTADLVGLDTLLRVARTLQQALPGDAALRVPPLLERLVEQGRLGVKSGTGFYRRAEKGPGGAPGEILMLDPRTLDYVPLPALDPRAAGAAAKIPAAGARVAALLSQPGPATELLSAHLLTSLHYAALCAPQIADDLPSIDRAMRWGFGWALGPFELWDAIGVPQLVSRLSAAGLSVPPLVSAVQAQAEGRFYSSQEPGRRLVYDQRAGRPVALPPRARVLDLDERRSAGAVVETLRGASLLDLGEGVFGLEFHSRLNVLGEDAGALLERGLRRVQREGCGLVIGNQADNFSAGADLKAILALVEAGQTADVSGLVRRFQALNQALRFSAVPVVVACRGLTLGGGCELALHASRVVAARDSYLGLVEVGAGLIPAGGGCKELVRRLDEAWPTDVEFDGLPFMQRSFTIVAKAEVSGSAERAQELGLLASTDRIVANVDQLLYEARLAVLELHRAGYRAPLPRQDLRVLGEAGLAALGVGLFNLAEARAISPHDRLVSSKLAHVFCGGARPAGARVSEQDLLDLEHEAFLSLLGEEKTRARMQALLTTGKPLRN
ncbi:MAG: 3-hydroxyacyl-CoA dehydrogenase/enoyl-CoA hydratase family protein [Planctomycetota bacterium]